MSHLRTVDVGELALGQVDVPVGEALQNLLQRDAAFESRQYRAEALVRADAERQVLSFLESLGNTEQDADDPHRHLRAEVGDEVESVGADQRSKLRAQNSRMFDSSSLILRGVNIRDNSLRGM